MRRVLFFSLCTAFLAVSVTSCNKDDDYFDAEILEGTDEQGAIVGKFSIAPNRQVQFSRGNLQYQASTDTWKFADHQYDVVGNGNLKRSATYSGWIDIFIRGASGNDPLLPPYASESYYDIDSVFHNGMNPNWYFVMCDISQTRWDWGSNAIFNGGNTPNKWRTLKSTEWNYLLFKRKDADKLLGFAIVNNQHGVVILPDNWETPDELDFINTDMVVHTRKNERYNKTFYYYGLANENHWVKLNNENFCFNDNIYSRDEWVKMQQYGAVFLPVAGVGDNCYEGASYWASDFEYYGHNQIDPESYMVSIWCAELGFVGLGSFSSSAYVRLAKDIQ